MKKILALLVLLAGISVSVIAAPPKVMLLPARQWCVEHGCVTVTNSNGKQKKVENYDKAFENKDLTNVEAEFKALMTAQGREFPVKSYVEAMDNAEFEDDLDEMFEGAQTGSGVGGSAFETLLASKGDAPDIYVKVNWTVNPIGLRNTVTFTIDAIDAYSSKSIATIHETTQPSAGPVAQMLMEGFRNHIDEFEAKLLDHFEDIQANGREINLRLVMIDNGSGMKFTDEYGGKELATIITDWVSDNTVNHQFSEKSSSRNAMAFDQVRIPLYDERNKPQQAKQWVTKLQDHLKNRYGIVAENNSNGLGDGRLYIGEK